jgi:His-Xaa-Ser system protein HxsD
VVWQHRQIVTDLQTTVAADRVDIDLDAGSCPRDAVYAAAYTFIDRCYVRLELRASDQGPGRIGITLRAKTAGSLDAAATAAELENELRAQAWRQHLADEGSELTASIVAAAFGVSSAPADGLIGGIGGIERGAPFDDPLGIAQSWEEKYAEKAGT